MVMAKTEKDLEIYDVWESPNGNLFLKMGGGYSLALGVRGFSEPIKRDLENCQFVKSSNTRAKKVGRIIFD